MKEAQQKALAYEIASVLDDKKSLAQFEQFTRTYSEEFLREKLAFVMAKKPEEITRTRGAYFTFLVKHHE